MMIFIAIIITVIKYWCE